MIYIESFIQYLYPGEREEGKDPTRPFFLKYQNHIRFGIGGKCGCFGIEIGKLKGDKNG